MKTITKAQYLYLKSKKNAELLKNETITIKDEEYEDLIQYSNKQIIPIDDGNDEPQEIYTITFKDGDEIVRKITGPMGTYVSVPYIEKEGYEFLGWSLDGEKVTMPVDGIYDSDITYIAVWEKIEQEEPIEPQEETYDYSGCDFGVNQWGYNIISLEDRTVSIKYCGNRYTLTEVIIPKTVEYNNVLFSVTSIGSSAFYYCTSLTSIDIPNGVTSIGSYAFSQCYGLTSIDIPNSVTSIGDYAFYYCTSLTSIDIPNSVTIIGMGAFQNCRGLTSIDIPNSVTIIGMSAFQNCRGLTSINISNGRIEKSAFYNCISLISITIYSANEFININELNIDHQITIYVLSELVNDYKSHYEKDIFLGKVNILPIE